MDDAYQRHTRLLILALIFVVAVLAAYFYAVDKMADPDMFWHVATGRWVAQHHQVPTTDPFSWSAKGHRWVAQEWLFGLIAYAVQHNFGWKGLYLFAALIDGALIMLIYALARARGVSPMWGFLVMIVALSGMLKYAVPRPQVVTWCLVVLVALLLEKGKWPWALVCVLIGVNAHGAVWPLYVILFAYYEFPKRWWLVLLAFGATFANPNPAGVFMYPIQAFMSPVAAQISEFQPTALWKFKWDLAMYAAMLVAVHRKRIHWRDALLSLAVIGLTLTAIRHVQWFYVLVLPILAPYIVVEREEVDRWWHAVLRWPVVARVRETLDRRARKPASGTTTDEALPLLEPAEEATGEGPAAGGETPVSRRLARSRLPEVLLIAALAVFAVFLGVRAYKSRVDVDTWYPAEELSYLRLHKIDRFFNDWREGGYLIYHGVPPMIDGRGDPYVAQEPGAPDMARDFISLLQYGMTLRDFLLKYDIEYVLLPGGGLLMGTMYDPAFTWVKATETHAILKFDPAVAKGKKTSSEQTATVSPRARLGLSGVATATAAP